MLKSLMQISIGKRGKRPIIINEGEESINGGNGRQPSCLDCTSLTKVLTWLIQDQAQGIPLYSYFLISIAYRSSMISPIGNQAKPSIGSAEHPEKDLHDEILGGLVMVNQFFFIRNLGWTCSILF